MTLLWRTAILFRNSVKLGAHNQNEMETLATLCYQLYFR